MIIDDRKIDRLLKRGQPDAREVSRVLDRAAEGKGLSLEDSAVLLSIEDTALLQKLYLTSGEVKKRVFGKRVVLFAPLYLSNHCTNGCIYCGFRSGSTGVERKALKTGAVVSEARALEEMGFKRVLLVTGEDPRYGLDYIAASVRAVYENTGIRIVHVNAPPMDTASFSVLKASGAGVYQAFQETYHRPTYERMHPSGRKKDYGYRLSVMDRAMEAGFDDVGIGPLLGLYDFKFECLSTIAHSIHLFETFGSHAHTISVPRLRPAASSTLGSVPYPVTDEAFKRIVAVFRLAVPSAGVVVSTRESATLRTELLHIGASQLSAASRTDPGGYTTHGSKETLEQFTTDDHRPLPDVMSSIVAEGFIPSLCTTCYRTGRTGHDFHAKTLEGDMGKFCQANAILTLKEYVSEHSANGLKTNDALKVLFEEAIKCSLDEIKDPAMKKAVAEKLKEIEKGERDLFF